jgi:nicotinic acid phosphoribosyltransferase
MGKPLDLTCIDEAEEKSGIDMQRLLENLALIKGNELTEREIIYLSLSLSRHINSYIAYVLYRHKFPTLEDLKVCKDIERIEQNMKSDMSKTVNIYVKELMGLNPDTNKPRWSKVIDFLNKNGYKKKTVLRSDGLEVEPQRLMIYEGDKIPTEIIESLKQNGIHNVRVLIVL